MRRSRPTPVTHLSQRGLSLVELMVALLISLILTAGIIQIFLGSSQTYRLQEHLSRTQENGRFAMEVMTDAVRMAGYFGCAIPRTLHSIANPPPPGFTLEAGSAHRGQLRALEGVDDAPAGTTVGGLPVVAGTDVLTIRGGSRPIRPLTQRKDAGEEARLNGNPGNWAVGDLLIISDCASVDLFRISGITAGNPVMVSHELTHNNRNTLSRTYGANNLQADLMALQTITFFLNRPAAGAPPSLWRQINETAPEELVEGVEDMQILYGIDTNGDGVTNITLTGTQVATQNRWPQVVAVRVSLLMVSQTDNALEAPQPVFFNNTLLTPDDRRFRQVVTATIGIRNRIP